MTCLIMVDVRLHQKLDWQVYDGCHTIYFHLRNSKFFCTFFLSAKQISQGRLPQGFLYDNCHTMLENFRFSDSCRDKKKPTPFGVGRLVGELTLINHNVVNFVHSNFLNTIHSVGYDIHFVLNLLFLTLFSLNLVGLKQLSLNHITLELK